MCEKDSLSAVGGGAKERATLSDSLSRATSDLEKRLSEMEAGSKKQTGIRPVRASDLVGEQQ